MSGKLPVNLNVTILNHQWFKMMTDRPVFCAGFR